ncbi:MAG: 4-hydroxythreonine-4-phosphate dehydrogenase PdxA [Pseudomonadota bacterium]
MAELPALLVTTGEPAGIGPDISLALALQDSPCRLVFAGDPDLLAQRAEQLGLSVRFKLVGRQGPEPHVAGTMQVVPHRLTAQVVPGQLNPANAPYVLGLLDTAIEGCLSGVYQAMVTAPLQKSVIADTGILFSGHTEYLAARTGTEHPVMLLVAGTLRVALATTHIPLSAVPGAINQAHLVATLGVLHAGLQTRFKIASPRVLVLGLNPHAGESGYLGREEIDVIAPAIAAARAAGIDARGPLPADTAFTPHALKDGDAVLAMFHDQGLPVLKHAGFGRGVNVTLGLPIIRTSVDHGTALDLAGSGRADAGSLQAALQLALDCVV